MAEIWFSSDLHLGHANIIKFCNRPFEGTWEMDEKLLAYHNTFVKPEDHWYNLGDVTMERDANGDGLKMLSMFNGHKRLIMGNHDHYDMKHYLKYFEKVMAMNRIDGIQFTHIPIHPTSMAWSMRANVHGHIHDQDAPPAVKSMHESGKVSWKPYINISVERTNYRPVALYEIKEMITKAIEKMEENGKTIKV